VAEGRRRSLNDNRFDGWKAQLRKGAAELAILAILERGEMYGLEVLDTAQSLAALGIAEGTVYPLLNRLEREGKLRSRWVSREDAVHPRKYYSLTAEGAATLAAMKEGWREFRSGLDDLLS
jgi:PadR family transcriptional regulator, regulatory protein PadR